MARPWKPREFDVAFERFICESFLASPEFQLGGAAYYRGYRSRYKECIRRFAALAPSNPVDVLRIRKIPTFKEMREVAVLTIQDARKELAHLKGRS